LYEVAPSLTDGTVVLDAFQLEDADSHLAGEDEEQANASAVPASFNAGRGASNDRTLA
jgi:hypothetical protein